VGLRPRSYIKFSQYSKRRLELDFGSEEDKKRKGSSCEKWQKLSRTRTNKFVFFLLRVDVEAGLLMVY
jgi:hypothetical protein